MPDWTRIGSFMDFCAMYFTTQLVRCALFSFILTGAVMLLRKTFFAGRIFLKGMLWSFFLLLPFLGRLKLFYENKVMWEATWWLTYGSMNCLWADRIYMAGIILAAAGIFGKRFRLRKEAAGMKKIMFENMQIHITGANVTPFTFGLLKPKIVLSKVMADSYGREELRAVVRHEQTHIRLGHLWCGFVWDILRCLLWINPFLTVIQKQFRADMEDICDRVCIQNSGGTAQEYGLLLLKTMKLLRSESEKIPSGVTYAGEREFAEMKRRMGNIAGFLPYRKRMCGGITAVGFLGFALLLFAIHTNSYARCNESNDIMVGKYDGKAEIISGDTGELERIISYDDRYVYVDGKAFGEFLAKHHAEGEIWIVFGGFYKLPGLGGAAEACVYESGTADGTENGMEDGMVRIPYESIMDSWYMDLLKWL